MKTKKTSVIFLLIFSFCISSPSQQGGPLRLVILHTNDLHSRLNGFSPESEYSPLKVNDDNTLGGFSRIAALINEEKQKHGDTVIVLDAGDFLMGTFFPILEASTGFQLPLMKKMGYDIVTLGNHEFDYGPDKLSTIIGKSIEKGPIPSLVATNICFSKKASADDSLKVWVDKMVLNPYQIIEKNGLKLGIIGLLGYNAIHDAPYARPLTFDNPVKTAKKYARLLKEKEKVDLVICLSHSGVCKDKNGNWSGEDVTLAQKVPEIDVVISGHTHTLLEKAIMVNGTPVVQTGSYGTGLGRLEIDVSRGKIIRSDYRVIKVNDAIPGDPEIHQMITAQEQQVTDRILQPLGLTYSSVITETSFPLVCHEDTLLANSNLGPLISDALYAYVNGHNKAGTDITMFPAGMIRDNINPGTTGKQSVADIFRVVSLGSGNDDIPGYPLARIHVTGKELKGIMEILYMAPSSSRDNYIYFGGLRATYDPERGLLKKITSIETGDDEKGYTPVDWSKQNNKLYSITANTYLLEFVGIIKKLSKGLVKVTLKNEKGEPIQSIREAVIDADTNMNGIQEIKDWKALIWYLQQQQDSNGNGIPEIPEYYRTGSPRLQRDCLN
ncbi:MAG: bifunctional metallophosphatase/5'-nucleotidase [Bacteroidales bacterium]|nr:bifunctional metallophosphatase/5'-nucleotidase [Bacteroidales bacterium]MBN2764088.1 bifunctional metallophosphatase/5'-nucleotidase [Bacteroidales bacterium]